MGNWSNFDEKQSGVTSVNQSRAANAVNEITTVSHSVGTTWATPAYDAAGNMTSIPKPAAPTTSYTATYDAWNRLVSLADASTAVAAYEYNGLGRQIVKSVYSTGALNHRLHFYYSEKWQILEVRKEASGVESGNPLEQHVWHPYYIDAQVTRFYDEDVNGLAIVQHYFTHDATFNVTALLNDAGAVVERYAYTPYGAITVLTAAFATVVGNTSTVGNAYTYTGGRLDAETGLYHFRNRFYHCLLGGFVTRDLEGYRGSEANLYEYANSSPENWTDPFGLKPSGCGCSKGDCMTMVGIAFSVCVTAGAATCALACTGFGFGWPACMWKCTTVVLAACTLATAPFGAACAACPNP